MNNLNNTEKKFVNTLILAHKFPKSLQANLEILNINKVRSNTEILFFTLIILSVALGIAFFISLSNHNSLLNEVTRLKQS